MLIFTVFVIFFISAVPFFCISVVLSARTVICKLLYDSTLQDNSAVPFFVYQ